MRQRAHSDWQATSASDWKVGAGETVGGGAGVGGRIGTGVMQRRDFYQRTTDHWNPPEVALASGCSAARASGCSAAGTQPC